MKRAFAAGLIIVVFALCGCARQQYTTLEEAVRAGAKIEKGITIDGADVYKIVRGEFTPTPAPEKTDGKTAAEISEEEKIEQEKHDDGDEGVIAPPLPDNG